MECKDLLSHGVLQATPSQVRGATPTSGLLHAPRHHLLTSDCTFAKLMGLGRGWTRGGIPRDTEAERVQVKNDDATGERGWGWPSPPSMLCRRDH